MRMVVAVVGLDANEVMQYAAQIGINPEGILPFVQGYSSRQTNPYVSNQRNQQYRPNNQGFDVQAEIEWLNSQGMYVDPDAGKYDWLDDYSGNVSSTNRGSSNSSADCYSNQIYWAKKQVKICRDGLSNAQSARSYVVQGTAGSWQVKLDDAERALAELELKQQACQSGRNR